MSDSSEGCVLDFFRFLLAGGLIVDALFLVAGIVYHIPFLIVACVLLLAPASCFIAGVLRRNRVLLRLGDLGGMMLIGVLIFVGALLYDMAFLAVIGGAWVLFSCYLIACAVRESRHEEQLAAIAQEWGLEFSRDDPIDIPRTYSALKLDSRGKTPRAANVIYGQMQEPRQGVAPGTRIKIFEYSLGMPEDEEHVSDVTVVLVDTRYLFPYVAVQSSGFPDRLAAAFLAQDMETGTPRFDKAFRVAATDPEFARRLLQGRLTEFLLHSWETRFKIEFSGGSIMVHKSRRLKPRALRRLVRFVLELCRKLPDDLPRAARP